MGQPKQLHVSKNLGKEPTNLKNTFYLRSKFIDPTCWKNKRIFELRDAEDAIFLSSVFTDDVDFCESMFLETLKQKYFSKRIGT